MDIDHFLQLLTKEFAGSISSEESERLSTAIKDSAVHANLYNHLYSFFSEGQRSTIDIDQKYREIWNRIQSNQLGQEVAPVIPLKIRSGFKQWFKVAGVLAILFGISLIFYYYIQKDPLKNLVYLDIQSNNEKKNFTLNDGTKVWLNKSSHIRYNKDFGKDKREIYLEGQAFFDVAKNKAVPLTVHAQTIDVIVKGTAFDIDAYPKSSAVKVALVRGLIEVHNKLDPGRNIIVKPDEKLVIPIFKHIEKPNGTIQPFTLEELNVDKRNKMLADTAWMQNKLIFQSEQLSDIIIKLEKWFDVKINITRPGLREQRFTGSFDKESLSKILDALSFSYSFNYTVYKDRIDIY